MPSYIAKLNDSDIVAGTSPTNKVLSPGAVTTSTFLISIAALGGAHNAHWHTERPRPNSDDWENGGTFTCKVRLVSASNMRVRVRLRRMSEAGGVLQSGSFTSYQIVSAASNTTYTFTPTVPTWTDAQEACGNRIAVQFQFRRVTSAAANATVQVGDIESEIVTTIRENNGGCRRINIA
jgi:hypothetical protein